MIEVHKTQEFASWLLKLKNHDAVARINIRIRRLQMGNAGDVKPVGEGVSELRIDYGAGYRVYFKQKGPLLILLLYGGDKRTQDTDIARAKTLAKEYSK